MAANTIGQVAKKAGVGIETVRFYERKGLITQPERQGTKVRDYPEDVVRRIRFIVHAKDLGFTLREVHNLLGLRSDPTANCDAVRDQAEVKIANIEEKMHGLLRMKATLQQLTDACQRRLPTAECPLLDVLDDEDGES